jgi:hypothetical protein
MPFNSNAVFTFQYTPSPVGLPLSKNIGKGQRNLFAPKIYSQFELKPRSYLHSKGLPLFSKESIVVLLLEARVMWNLRKIVIKKAMQQSRTSTSIKQNT